MNHQEQLFIAIGGADPKWVARSERRRPRRWPGYVLTAAACLALVLAVGYVLPQRTEPAGPQEPSHVTPPNPPSTDTPDTDGTKSFLPPQGGEIGTLRMLSYAPESQENAVDFLLYINEEQFYIREANGLYSIRNTSPLPENFPLCGLDVLHIPGTSPEEAKAAAGETLADHYLEILPEEANIVLPGSLYLRAQNGTDWDSEQAEVWFVDDGQGGTFVLTSRYFLEAEEGLGQGFRDMVSSFRVVSLNEAVPEWMRTLYSTTERLFPALLSNDLSGVSDLLTEDADAEAYGEDVWENLRIASVDYTPDSDRDPSSAIVSVKHRLNLEEGESFNYLTMKLLRQDGQWRLAWSGIEK